MRVLVVGGDEDRRASRAPTSSSTSKPSSFGIWMSSSSRSGFSSVTAFTASKPLPHSADDLHVGCAPRAARAGCLAPAARRPRRRRESSGRAFLSWRAHAAVTAGIRTSTQEAVRRASPARPHRDAPHCVVRRLRSSSSPSPTPRVPRPIGVARVLERDRQCRSLAGGGQPNRAAFDQLGDAVDDGVLDERLQEQRRHEAVGRAPDRFRASPADERRAAPARWPGSARPARARRPSVMRLFDPSRSVSRRNSARSRHMRRAAAGSLAVSALIECRLLKMKCGSICARSALSSASRASRSSSIARRSASRDASNAMSR